MHPDAFLELGDVGDHADLAPGGLEGFECGDGQAEAPAPSTSARSPKAFIAVRLSVAVAASRRFSARVRSSPDSSGVDPSRR